MTPIAPATRTLFAELVQQVTTAPRAGTVYTRERDGIRYHYAKLPIGGGRVDRFIGKVGDPAAEAAVARLQLGMSLARGRRRLVAMLKTAGLAHPLRPIGAVLDTLAESRLFEGGAVLVGTVAYMVMEPLVGHLLPSPTLLTGDVDLATADLALQTEPPEQFEEVLKRADPSFEAIMQIDPRLPPSRFRSRNGLLVDLLTPMLRRSDRDPMPLDQLAAGAAPLHYLDWLIAEPVTAVALWGSGVPIKVPQPARFAVHKLILAQRRTSNRAKRQKDLAQANALIDALRIDDPYALDDALDDARARGDKGWRIPIARSLDELGRTDI